MQNRRINRTSIMMSWKMTMIMDLMMKVIRTQIIMSKMNTLIVIMLIMMTNIRTKVMPTMMMNRYGSPPKYF